MQPTRVPDPAKGIASIHDAGREVDIKLSIDARGVRLDVTVKDNAGRTIDVEMLLKDEKNVLRRMRYYSGAIDQTILEKGMNYSRLSETVVLFITQFDPFGKDLIRYTFRNLCMEDKELELGDGTTKIVLNAVGTKGDVSDELKGFLDLVAGTSDVKEGSFADRVQKEVVIARRNSEWRRQYMEWKMTLLKDPGREGHKTSGVKLLSRRRRDSWKVYCNRVRRRLASNRYPEPVKTGDGGYPDEEGKKRN